MRKNIEIVEKTIKEEVVTYKTIDGRTFTNEEHAREWEDDYKCTVNMTFKNMKKAEVEGDKIGIPYWIDDMRTFVVLPKNEEEIVAINAIKRFIGVGGTPLSLVDVDKEIILNFGYGYSDDYPFGADWLDIYVLDTYKDNIINSIDECYELIRE